MTIANNFYYSFTERKNLLKYNLSHYFRQKLAKPLFCQHNNITRLKSLKKIFNLSLIYHLIWQQFITKTLKAVIFSGIVSFKDLTCLSLKTQKLQHSSHLRKWPPWIRPSKSPFSAREVKLHFLYFLT